MTQSTDGPASLAARRVGGICLLLIVTAGADAQTAAPPPPPAAADTSTEHTSYLFGLTFGEQMHAVGITDQVDAASIERGVKDGLQGKKSTRADQQQIQEYVHSIMAAAATRNKDAAREFLARNGHEKNVKTTASGLEYKVLIPGDPKAPAVLPADEVSVNYRGKLLDGTEFDSSYARGIPASFKINGVIQGWQEALVLMKPGAKWQLFIPPELAYGDSPRPSIPAGSLLIFEVELLSVKPSAAAQLPSQPQPQAPTTPGTPGSHRAVPPLTPTPNQ